MSAATVDGCTLRGLVDDYRTCELATLTRSGLPMAWPTAPLVDERTGTITVTTSIALPQKAFNVRRDPRVAVLFSDPTGSGRRDLPQVLVRGTAVCPEDVHTSPRGLEEYWARLAARQPSSRSIGATALSRWLMDWYQMRLVITITPTSVETHPPLVEPEGQAGAARRGRARRGRAAEDAFSAFERRLGRFRSAVLAWPAADEPPVLRRVSLVPEADERCLRVESLGGELPGDGPASLLLHSHDEDLADLRLAACVGRVEEAGQQRTTHVRFRPERVVPVPGDGTTPLAMLRTVRTLRRTARRYLERRGLGRPAVAWEEFAALARAAGPGPSQLEGPASGWESG